MNRKLFATVALLLVSLLMSLGAEVALADSGASTLNAAHPLPLVKFQGVVSSRPQGKVGVWVIGDYTVKGVESTILDETLGPAEVGAHVTVLARRVPVAAASDVELEAILIRVLGPAPARPMTIRGRIGELEPTYLVVNGIKILYDSSTNIEGELEVGVFVEVRAILTSEGLKAQAIKVLPDENRIIEFEGVIESIGRPEWVIDGRKVTVTILTLIIGRPEVGEKVKVRALVKANGELVALMIQVVHEEPVPVDWTGVIEQLPPNILIFPPTYLGRWVVGGRPVWVTVQTEISGTPKIGLNAHVEALDHPRRHLEAQKIEVLNGEPDETPEPTPGPLTLTVSSLLPGDILTRDDKTISFMEAHDAIYVGDGQIIDSLPGGGVQYRSLAGFCADADDYLVAHRLAAWNETTAQGAIAYAVAHIGTPYDFNFFGGKDTEDKMYCSELVWRAYLSQAIDLDFNGGPWVWPGEIVRSRLLVEVEAGGP